MVATPHPQFYDRKPTWPKPAYGGDGVLASDYRKVRRGKAPGTGRVKAWGQWWEGSALLPYVGAWVWVRAGEYWVVWIQVFERAHCDYSASWICDLGEK